MTAAEAAAVLLHDEDLFAGWAPIFKDVITAACTAKTANSADARLDIKALCMLPQGHRWETKPGVTLVGDAAHLMLPFACLGVNLAMWDSLNLSAAIGSAARTGGTSPVDFHYAVAPAIQRYEDTMLSMARDSAEETMNNKKMMFDTDNGSEIIVDSFKRDLL